MIMKNSFNLQDDVQKRNLKNSILGFVRSGWGLLVILMLSACLFNFGEYPSKYYDYEWTEITETQARELWKTYDTTTKLHSTAKVYKDYPKKGYIVPDCKVVKDTLHDEWVLEVMAEVVHLTFNYSDYDDRDTSEEAKFQMPKFYTCKEDSSLVMVVGEGSWYDSRVFSNGWMVEGRKDADYGYSKDHEYYLIVYTD